MATLSPLDSLRFPGTALEDLSHLAQNRSYIGPVAERAQEFVSTFPFRKVAAGVGRAVNLDEVKARGILNSLLNIVTLVGFHKIDSPELVPLFTARLEQAATNQWKDENLDAWIKAEDAIVAATRIDGPLFLFHKTRLLANLHENVVHSLRIITDIRPVFNNDGTALTAGVISHQLVVEYVNGDDDDHERICLTLDAEDIEELYNQSARARQKASLLLDEFKSAHWTVINFGESK
jgi:hypothetical protein